MIQIAKTYLSQIANPMDDIYQLREDGQKQSCGDSVASEFCCQGDDEADDERQLPRLQKTELGQSLTKPQRQAWYLPSRNWN